jgi:hypothetical protein
MWPPDRVEHARSLARSRAAGAAQFDAAWRAGRALTAEQALATATAATAASPGEPPVAHGPAAAGPPVDSL